MSLAQEKFYARRPDLNQQMFNGRHWASTATATGHKNGNGACNVVLVITAELSRVMAFDGDQTPMALVSEQCAARLILLYQSI